MPPIGIAQAREIVKILYRALLRRTPEEIETDHESVEDNARAFQRTSLGAVVEGFITRAEFGDRWRFMSARDIARIILENLPGAPGDDSAITRLAGEIASREAGRRIAGMIDPLRTA